MSNKKDMKEKLTISFIIPVYNRPDEIQELLQSMFEQTQNNFEVVVVEDGSEIKCQHICQQFKDKLDIKYFFKSNSGPGQSRNYGFEKASGNYGIFLDSDCLLPPNYFKTVHYHLQNHFVDCFGGPDRAHPSFSLLQKAINYSMTSFFTTGGIRGNSEKMDKFFPRSFNMGYSKSVFLTTKGFSKMRFGEDIDMSLRILKHNFKTKLIKDAFVYHKRRTNFRQFFKQIFNSGIARINLYLKYPQSLKVVHIAPALFTIGTVALLLLSIFHSWLFIWPILLHMLLLLLDASIKNKNIRIGLLSIVSSYIQLLAYGLGFISAVWKRLILKKKEFSAYEKTFYD
jgi:glycosyltransferase involved in cell wall biosynthesis